MVHYYIAPTRWPHELRKSAKVIFHIPSTSPLAGHTTDGFHRLDLTVPQAWSYSFIHRSRVSNWNACKQLYVERNSHLLCYDIKNKLHLETCDMFWDAYLLRDMHFKTLIRGNIAWICRLEVGWVARQPFYPNLSLGQVGADIGWWLLMKSQ